MSGILEKLVRSMVVFEAQLKSLLLPPGFLKDEDGNIYRRRQGESCVCIKQPMSLFILLLFFLKIMHF